MQQKEILVLIAQIPISLELNMPGALCSPWQDNDASSDFNNNIYKTPISKISIISSNFSIKSDRIICIFYKNVNGLSMDRSSQRFLYKYRMLRQLQRVFDPDLIAIIVTQVNPFLLDSSYNIPEFLFQSDLYAARLSNNSKELIGKR